jgi:hypothetical protein
MMSLRIWGMFCRVVLPGYTWSAAWHRAVRSSGTVVVPYEWLKRPVMQCSRMSAHLTDIKCAACPHILQTYDGPDIKRLKNMRVCVGNMRA